MQDKKLGFIEPPEVAEHNHSRLDFLNLLPYLASWFHFSSAQLKDTQLSLG